MVRSKRSASVSVNALVGSSITMIDARRERALAISTSCWSPTRKSPVMSPGEIAASSKANNSLVFLSALASSSKPNRVLGSRPRKTLAATDNSSTSSNS